MQFVKDHFTHTIEIKQSKFIAHLIPYSNYDSLLAALKEEHPKARHFVVAWRYMNEFDQIVEHCSDDGEPKGTSGKPTLSVLAGQEIINSAVIIVRYFGGTKLGTGGLVRAYSQACNEVLSIAKLYPYVKLHRYHFSVKYSDISMIEYQLAEHHITIYKKEFDATEVRLSVDCEASHWQNFYTKSERIIRLISESEA